MCATFIKKINRGNEMIYTKTKRVDVTVAGANLFKQYLLVLQRKRAKTTREPERLLKNYIGGDMNVYQLFQCRALRQSHGI